MWKIMNTRKTSNLMIYNLFELEKICELEEFLYCT